MKQAKALKADGGLAEIKYHHLDITDSSSIESLADYLKEAHTEGIDFVINNAGIALNGFGNIPLNSTKMDQSDNIPRRRKHRQRNPPHQLLQHPFSCHTLLPALKPSGRIVNVASSSGALSKYSDAIRTRFLTAQSEADITSIMQDFAAAVAQGREKAARFPSAAYATSKAGCIGGTKALARMEKQKGSGKLVNACCPGYVNTDMTKGNGTKTPDQGALTPVLLAIQDIGGKTGEFWRNERVVEW